MSRGDCSDGSWDLNWEVEKRQVMEVKNGELLGCVPHWAETCWEKSQR